MSLKRFFGSQKFKACFKNHVEFQYPNNIEDFDMCLDFFQKKRNTECNDNILMGEDNAFNKLIVMDDVSGLADKSNNFANFLNVSDNLTSPVSMFFLRFILPEIAGK